MVNGVVRYGIVMEKERGYLRKVIDSVKKDMAMGIMLNPIIHIQKAFYVNDLCELGAPHRINIT